MTPPSQHPDFTSAIDDAANLSSDQLLIQTYAATRVLMERTADLPEIKAKVSRHENDLRIMKWLGGTAFTAVLGICVNWVKVHLLGQHS